MSARSQHFFSRFTDQEFLHIARRDSTDPQSPIEAELERRLAALLGERERSDERYQEICKVLLKHDISGAAQLQKHLEIAQQAVANANDLLRVIHKPNHH